MKPNLERPGPADNERLLLMRAAFLDALERVAPCSMNALHEQVLPAFKRCQRMLVGHDLQRAFRDWSRFEVMGEGSICLCSLRDAIVGWSRANHLNAPWVQEAVLRGLRTELRSSVWGDGYVPGAASTVRQASIPRLILAPVAGYYPSSLSVPAPRPWDPTSETKQAYLAEINCYLEATERQYLEAGWRRASNPRPGTGTRRGQTKRQSPSAYDWLVRRLVLGEDIGDKGRQGTIAGDADVTRQAVATRTSELAAILGLLLGETSTQPVLLRFLIPQPPYRVGEIAAFPPDVATAHLARGVAALQNPTRKSST